MLKRKSPAANCKPQTNKINPELPGGFRDYGPEDSILRQHLLEKIKKTFEDFGFDPMETPAIERTAVLLGGEKEFDKIIFNVNSSMPDKLGRRLTNKDGKLSLRFDMTVPLARFIAAKPELPKPFKRYQIGASWRGESPQQGRYREFLQADCDIVGSSSTEADAEVITVLHRIFKNLGIGRFVIKINHRKILNGLPQYADFRENQLPEVLRFLDKKDKIGEAAVLKNLVKLIRKDAAERIIEFTKISGGTREKIQKAQDLLKNSEGVQEGIKELAEIAQTIKASGVEENNWEIDFSIVRGLGYYTGSIFEVFLTAKPEFGSVASGGRYDNLSQIFTGQSMPFVGASIGVDRLYAAVDSLGLFKKENTLLKVLILNLTPELKDEYYSLANVLRDANISTAIYLGDDRAFRAQLAYAVRKEIPYVIIYGKEEKQRNVVAIKNLALREQKEIPKVKILEYFKKYSRRGLNAD